MSSGRRAYLEVRAVSTGNDRTMLIGRWHTRGNDEFTLSITGKGAMADYKCNITRDDATQPWRESETGVEPTEITRVVVETA